MRLRFHQPQRVIPMPLIAMGVMILKLIIVSPLLAGSTQAESPIITVETRAFGIGAETSDITVDTRTPFDFWTASMNLQGPASTLTAIPYHDGVTNLLKWAFNLSGNIPQHRIMDAQGTAGLPLGERISGNQLRFTCLRRKNIPGLSYIAKFSSDSISWQEITTPDTITAIDSEWERVTFVSPADYSGSRLLGTIQVVYNPP
jgi:hypothetical protein